LSFISLSLVADKRGGGNVAVAPGGTFGWAALSPSIKFRSMPKLHTGTV